MANGRSMLVNDSAGVPVPPNWGIVGDRLHHVESGVITTWVHNVGSENLTEAFPFRPEMVGQSDPQIVLGMGSGLDSVMVWLEIVRVSASQRKAGMVILHEVQATPLQKKGLLSEVEFSETAHGVLGAGMPSVVGT